MPVEEPETLHSKRRRKGLALSCSLLMGFLSLSVSLQWQFTLAGVGPSGGSHWFQFLLAAATDFRLVTSQHLQKLSQCAFPRHQIKPVGSFPLDFWFPGSMVFLLWAQKHQYQASSDWFFEVWVSAACDGAFPSFLSFSNSLSLLCFLRPRSGGCFLVLLSVAL